MSAVSQPALVECVPNFSEGREPQRLEPVLAVIRGVTGVRLLDVDPGADTNRTVVTFVGPPEAVEEAAFRAIRAAAQVIDMRTHQGAHPRHGATDVCPFIPVAGVTMEDCVAIARRVGERVGRELDLPVYLYEHAATRPERRSLAAVRRGEYEALPDKLRRPEWKPDYGPARFVPETGVVTIGAREFLIAYNVNLNTRLKEHATDLAFDLREAGRVVRDDQRTPIYMSGAIRRYQPSRGRWPCGYDDTVCGSRAELERHMREVHQLDFATELAFFGQDPAQLENAPVQRRGLFQHCRAVGWVIPEYGRAQVSINLTNYQVTGMHDVVDACRRIGAQRGIVVTGSELVGLAPHAALRAAGEHYLAASGASRGVPEADVIEAAVQSLGLADLRPFDPQKSVLGLPVMDGPLVNQKVYELVDEVSRPSPAPGGGSIAALAGSLAAGLASMVANLTHGKARFADHHAALESHAIECQRLKDALLRAVDADTSAFNTVLTAVRMPQETEAQRAERRQAIQAGYQHATQVPLQTAELCLATLHVCRRVIERCLESSITDVAVGGLMAHAGLRGSIYNVEVNLHEITDPAWVADLRGRLGAITSEGDRLANEIATIVRMALEARPREESA